MKIYIRWREGKAVHVVENATMVPRIGDSVEIAAHKWRVVDVVWDYEMEENTVDVFIDAKGMMRG